MNRSGRADTRWSMCLLDKNAKNLTGLDIMHFPEMEWRFGTLCEGAVLMAGVLVCEMLVKS